MVLKSDTLPVGKASRLSRFTELFEFQFHIVFDLVDDDLESEVVLELKDTPGMARSDILVARSKEEQIRHESDAQ